MNTVCQKVMCTLTSCVFVLFNTDISDDALAVLEEKHKIDKEGETL